MDQFNLGGNPQIFGDNENLCLCFDAGEQKNTLNMKNVIVRNLYIDIQKMDHYTAIHRRQIIDQVVCLGFEIILTLQAGEVIFSENQGLILPPNQFREATILELLRMVNERITCR